MLTLHTPLRAVKKCIYFLRYLFCLRILLHCYTPPLPHGVQLKDIFDFEISFARYKPNSNVSVNIRNESAHFNC